MTNETPTIVFSFETTLPALIPGNGNDGTMKKAMQAMNIYKIGRPLTWEDNENTVGEEKWKELQKIHASMHRVQHVPVILQVDSNGRISIE